MLLRAEFCEECGIVWRTSGCTARRYARPIDMRSSEESTFCVTAERNQQPTVAWGSAGNFSMALNYFAFILTSCNQVSLILNNAVLFGEWKEDIKTMAGRIIQMRKELHRLLTEEFHTPGNWDHIVNQIGMFRYWNLFIWNAEKLKRCIRSFTGINSEQSKWLVEKKHIYLTVNGRISMAGLNSHNIEYFARALDNVVRR